MTAEYCFKELAPETHAKVVWHQAREIDDSYLVAAFALNPKTLTPYTYEGRTVPAFEDMVFFDVKLTLAQAKQMKEQLDRSILQMEMGMESDSH